MNEDGEEESDNEGGLYLKLHSCKRLWMALRLCSGCLSEVDWTGLLHTWGGYRVVDALWKWSSYLKWVCECCFKPVTEKKTTTITFKSEVGCLWESIIGINLLRNWYYLTAIKCIHQPHYIWPSYFHIWDLHAYVPSKINTDNCLLTSNIITSKNYIVINVNLKKKPTAGVAQLVRACGC